MLLYPLKLIPCRKGSLVTHWFKSNKEYMIDKEKQKEYSDNHYQKNKQRIKKRAKEHTRIAIERNKKFIREFLLKNPCTDCGNKNPIVLEFDHVIGDKIDNVSKLVAKGCSIKTLEKEIAKCEVRCANCHRIVTHERRIRQRPIEGVDYFEY